MADALTYDEIVRLSVAQGVPQRVAERAAAMEIARRLTPSITLSGTLNAGRSSGFLPPPILSAQDAIDLSDGSRRKVVAHVGADRFAVCRAQFSREHDTFRATYETPPRTKKNNTVSLWSQKSLAYKRYERMIVEVTAGMVTELTLPLPIQSYNLQAIFYVDKPGERADLFGLLQAIADALQSARVITNDWHFRTVDGSRVVTGDDLPRVEVTITPTED